MRLEDPQRLLVVRDWDTFLDEWLVTGERDAAGRSDTIVPTPLMPHLLADWLERPVTSFLRRNHPEPGA